MGEYLQDTKLQWFGLVERMEESARYSKCRNLSLVVVSLENDLRKHGMRQAEVT